LQCCNWQWCAVKNETVRQKKWFQFSHCELSIHSDLQNITQKTKRSNNTNSLKIGDEPRCSGRVSSSCSTSDTRRVIVKRHEHHLI
jgi:hypothetical protein